MTRAAAALLAPVLLAGCATGAPRAGEPPPSASPAVEIAERLHASAEAWNRGDLDGFLDPYLDSSRTTFMGGSGLVRGLDRVRARYASSYWRDGAPTQRLRFDALAVRRLGPEHALVTGRYILADATTGATVSSGFFSLVWRDTGDGWRIIHDHSSAGES